MCKILGLIIYLGDILPKLLWNRLTMFVVFTHELECNKNKILFFQSRSIIFAKSLFNLENNVLQNDQLPQMSRLIPSIMLHFFKRSQVKVRDFEGAS